MQKFFLFLSLCVLVSCQEILLNLEEKASKVQRPMVTTWVVGDADYGDGDLSITLPLRTGYNYDFVVDWGDGNRSVVTSHDDVNATHVYDMAGEYEVRINGLAEAWYFNSSGDRNKIKMVNDFGGLGWINLEASFKGCMRLESFRGGIRQMLLICLKCFVLLTHVC